ncbi:hypothetical protein JCM1393_06010 [Clostridium carnis]
MKYLNVILALLVAFFIIGVIFKFSITSINVILIISMLLVLVDIFSPNKSKIR